MTTRSTRFFSLLSLFSLATTLAACDGPDDGDTDVERDAIVMSVDPIADADLELELHPCGNGTIDNGEWCDDGLANGPQRECTHQCTFNVCELDALGWCEPPSPAADVPLYPVGEDCEVDEDGHCEDDILGE